GAIARQSRPQLPGSNPDDVSVPTRLQCTSGQRQSVSGDCKVTFLIGPWAAQCSPDSRTISASSLPKKLTSGHTALNRPTSPSANSRLMQCSETNLSTPLLERAQHSGCARRVSL